MDFSEIYSDDYLNALEIVENDDLLLQDNFNDVFEENLFLQTEEEASSEAMPQEASPEVLYYLDSIDVTLFDINQKLDRFSFICTGILFFVFIMYFKKIFDSYFYRFKELK